MKFFISEKTLAADSCEVRVVNQDGPVYLRFIRTERGPYCVSRSVEKAGCSIRVPRDTFMEAREKARDAMNGKLLEERDGGLTNQEIARRVRETVRRSEGKVDVFTALDTFLRTATWCNRGRRPAIVFFIGQMQGAQLIAGAEARRDAEERQTEKTRRREAEAARQPDLFAS